MQASVSKSVLRLIYNTNFPFTRNPYSSFVEGGFYLSLHGPALKALDPTDIGCI